jgi:hypothetical protein
MDITNLTLGERSPNTKEYILYNSFLCIVPKLLIMFEGKFCLPWVTEHKKGYDGCL